MRKILSLLIIISFLFSFWWIVNASEIKIISKEKYEEYNKEITLWDMFIFFAGQLDWKIPETYRYIDVKIKWLDKSSEIYKSVQKLIYVDILNNSDVYLNPYKKINAYSFYTFAWKVYKTDLIDDKTQIVNLKLRNAKNSDIHELKTQVINSYNKFELNSDISNLETKKEIFSEVYKSLTKKHYLRDSIDKEKMLDQAIKWLAEWTWDKYTTYFPPIENKDFTEWLTWEYEWIWAYVDMEKAWEFKIVSPIPGSPAERAWLKWWDIVTKVDWKEVTEDNSVSEVVSWIKWPAWTTVKLSIKRWTKTFDLVVDREKIVLKEVEAKKLNSSTYYIQMKFFGPHIWKEFKESLEILKTDKSIKKIIFDLRWNWWWYLNGASNVLSYFVPHLEATAVIKYYNNEQTYKSRGYTDIDFSKYKLVVLENGWTASASEIFIWTLKDYFPDTTIIWEKSYWKWSVQTIKTFKDWSSLKYTIAQWYTWKNHNWIDWTWIKPDIEIKMEKYWVEEEKDLQLQKAIKLK